MFEIGSFIVYRSEGVCVVSDISIENFGMIGKDEQYYKLTPINDRKSTVFVPLANERLVAFMRPLMSAEEINKMADELRDERMEWLPDSRGRNNAFRDVLSRGDRRELCVLVNTVNERLEQIARAGKKAGSTELSALSKAEKMLYEEFSATTDISSIEQISLLLKGEIRLGERPE